jgi:hypothetical protein
MKFGKSKGILTYIIIISIIFIFAVLIANKQTMKENFFNNKRYSVEYYYMDTCGHCIEFNDSGIWERLNNITWVNVSLNKYNRSENLERVKLLNISSFPTIIVIDRSINNDTIIDSFEEERTYDKLFNFIKKYDLNMN